VPRPHRFVYFCVMIQQNVDSRDRRNLFSSCAYSAYNAQTARPSPNLIHERHILGMSTSPRNNSHCPKLCRLSCTPITNTTSKYPFSVVLGTYKTLAQKFGNFSTIYACAHRLTSLVQMLIIGVGYVAESPRCGPIGDRQKQNTFWHP